MNSVSRRSFIGTSAVSLVSLGAATVSAIDAGVDHPADELKRAKDIRTGMLTAPLRDLPFDEVLNIAKRCHIAALEVVAEPGHPHIDPRTLDTARADSIKAKLGELGLEISALSNYMNCTAPGRAGEVQAIFNKTIDAAALLGAPTICVGLGMPVRGKSKIQMIKEVIPGLFRPVIDHAKEKGIKVAVENWFETNLQGLDTLDCLMQTIPDDNFGFNYDPSHFVHQQCDYMAPVSMFSKRIFHTHAKDTLVNEYRRAYVGVLGQGWWRYTIPGFGNINWGQYIGQLRNVGYKGVLSIEHEDDTFGPEEGFRHGANYLNQFCNT
jgi:sugar phosphate isomerase/epimerase